MKLKLASAPNPDFDQTSAPMPALEVEVHSVQHASLVCRYYIDSGRLGAGNWTGGDITNDDGELVARISYNGRAWSPTGEEIPF